MRFLAFLPLILFTSCHEPIPEPIKPPSVRASDLAESFRLSVETANDAYTGQKIVIFLNNYVVRDRQIHWHLGSEKVPAVIVCEFVQPFAEPKGPVWISGTCAGRIRDGAAREIGGYEFHVLITGCRVVPPPTVPKP